MLFLVHAGLLDQPVLYMSRYIIAHKVDYYRRLRGVTESQAWADWVAFMLDCTAVTANETLTTIQRLNALREHWEAEVAARLARAPVRRLVDLMMSYPYLRIAMLVDTGIAARQTASSYLHELAHAGLLRPQKRGRDVYFVNEAMVDILRN